MLKCDEAAEFYPSPFPFANLQTQWRLKGINNSVHVRKK
jgi:hypothetical protein